ncbi:hypothetical protein Acr_17g0007410 [Actinidia rufa]|uniref:Reverse transcriptase domain-containing protein n=1 Tax=Actinidia rufa TaxID=165716 RepID=A0A7J0G316_9ERIC|nr:hypothetical protein Acr_17g0007410 [Actinidia rufa]
MGEVGHFASMQAPRGFYLHEEFVSIRLLLYHVAYNYGIIPHMAFSYVYSDIYEIYFHTHPSENHAVLSLHGYPFSNYKKVASFIYAKTLVYYKSSSILALPSLPLPWSDSHAGGVLCGLTTAGDEEIRRRGRSPHHNEQVPRCPEESTTQKIMDLDAKINAINTGANAPITVDALGYSDKAMCKAFSVILKGSARTWIRKMSLGTIDSFGDLSRLFVANFMSYRVRQKNASLLFIVHQKEGKSLKDYIKWFNQALLEVKGVSDKTQSALQSKKNWSRPSEERDKGKITKEMSQIPRYHQIKMYQPGMEKTFFIMERGLYRYNIMPFGLKNARAMYQRLVNKIFKEMIRKTMEVYIDDMLIKSLEDADHTTHLEEVFGILWKHKIMLNPSKCILGVSLDKFLSFLVTKHGIEANPNQNQALLAMSLPRNIHEVQQLTGHVAAFNRFVSQSVDKCMPFFKILIKNIAFKWMEESKMAFQ